MVGTSKLRDLYERFEEELGKRQERAKAVRPMWDPPKTKLDEDPGGQTCKTSWVQFVISINVHYNQSVHVISMYLRQKKHRLF